MGTKNIMNHDYQNETLISNDPIFEVERLIRELIREKIKIKYEFEQFKEESEIKTKEFLLGLLEVVDAFERLFNIIKTKEELMNKQTKIWIGNFRTIYKLLLRALKRFGVSPIDTFIDEIVNPYIHTVVEVVKRPGKENGTIVEIIKKGYLWEGELLRSVEVKAVKND